MADAGVDASEQIRTLLLAALADRNVAGVVRWKPVAADAVRKDLGCSVDAVMASLEDHVRSGGRVKYKPEQRLGFEHDRVGNAIVNVSGCEYFVEFVFDSEEMDDPQLVFVSAHFPLR